MNHIYDNDPIDFIPAEKDAEQVEMEETIRMHLWLQRNRRELADAERQEAA